MGLLAVGLLGRFAQEVEGPGQGMVMLDVEVEEAHYMQCL